MLSVFCRKRSDTATVDVCLIDHVVVRVDALLSTIAIEIHSTLEGVDSADITCYPVTCSNGILKVSVAIIVVIVSPSCTLRAEDDVLTIVEDSSALGMLVAIRLINLMYDGFDFESRGVDRYDIHLVPCTLIALEENQLTIRCGMNELYILVRPFLDRSLLCSAFLNVDDGKVVLDNVLVARILILVSYKCWLWSERIDYPEVLELAVVVSYDEDVAAVITPTCVSSDFAGIVRIFLFFSWTAVREVLHTVEGELNLSGVHAFSLVSPYIEVVLLGIKDIFLVWRKLHPGIYILIWLVLLLLLYFRESIVITIVSVTLAVIFKLEP